MRSGGQTLAGRRLSLPVLIFLLAAVGPALASDSIVYFKNGRALRVLDTRADGDWVYLLISEPGLAGRRGGEEEPNEIGVRADSIARIEGARTAAPASSRSGSGGRSANGVVREHSMADALAAARSSMPGGGTLDEELQKVPNVPAMGTPEAAQYKPSSSGGGIPDDIEPGSSIAGYEIRAPLRNMRPPKHIMERARQLQEQRRQQRAARQAAETQPTAPAPPPAPQSAPPSPPPDGEGADGSGN